MKIDEIKRKIVQLAEAKATVRIWKDSGEKIVWTNGCFDILHFGHIAYLAAASDLGTKLVIGINSDESVSRLKGPSRPIIDEQTRLLKIAALEMVDLVICYMEETPLRCIEQIKPDVLVKGGDYRVEDIVGYSVVKASGGQVCTIPFEIGHSTSKIIQRIKEEK